MKKTVFCCLLLAACCGFADENAPILPGWGKYFWNTNAVWYMHPPAFDFGPVAGAKAYRFRVIADKRATNFFTAASAKADLAPVWPKLPRKGYITVRCEGVDAKGAALGFAGETRFWKNAPFKEGAYAPAVRPYGEAASRAYAYIFAMPALKTLAKTGKPDPDYMLNCYPSKMHAAIIEASVHAAKNDPTKRNEMLVLARAAADYLIATAEPEGAPLAHFTQTYSKEIQKATAKKYQGQHMLDYPCRVGSAFVRLYGLSGDKKYLDAAEKIAKTYLKLQGDDGTWFLKMWAKDGTSVTPNRLIPHNVCTFLEELYTVTKCAAYRASADRAFGYIEKGPLENWNWEGQFEDVAPSARYKNLTKHPAVDAAMHLLRRYPKDAKRRAQARALMDFAEDQFVVWEAPWRADGFAYPKKTHQWSGDVTTWWCFPTVMEQYRWYVPTDASVAKMIRGYLAIYAVEKNPVDLAKARALGDAYTRAQREGGRIPTQWMAGWDTGRADVDWINCMIASANALTELAEAVKR